jgi:hypothetical protein
LVKNSYGTASEGHGRKKPLELHNNGVTQHLSRTNNDSFCTDDRHVVVVVVAVVVVVVVVVVVETFFFLVDGGDYFFVDDIFVVGNGFDVV